MNTCVRRAGLKHRPDRTFRRCRSDTAELLYGQIVRGHDCQRFRKSNHCGKQGKEG